MIDSGLEPQENGDTTLIARLGNESCNEAWSDFQSGSSKYEISDKFKLS